MPGERHDPTGERPQLLPHAHVDNDLLSRLFPLTDSPDDHNTGRGAAVGIRLGHFIIEERIGRGGMGGVFRAVDERLNRVVALKVLASARDAASIERFRNEAQAAARLDHENIARVYYIGDDQGIPFIAFEFVRGANVKDIILQKGMLSPEEAVNYTLQIAQALRHTQAARVVHRDIKPSNIIITPSGHAKLVDLGLARQEQTEPARELTVPGTTLGTFDYIAPEQARDPRCVDVRTDIYSLGCTLYHMLTGQPPFPQGTMIEKVVEHHRDTPPDPAVRNPLVPPQLSQIVRTMMASDPDDRYPDPDALIVELSQIAASLGLRPAHPDNLIWTRPMYERQPGFFDANRGWLVTLAALFLIAAGIQLFPPGQPTPQRPDESLTQTPSADSGSPCSIASAIREPGDGSPRGSVLTAPPSPETTDFNGMRRGLAALNLTANSAALADGPVSPAPAAPEDLQSNDESPADARARRMETEAFVRNIEQLNAPIPDRRTPPTGNRPESPAIAELPFVVRDARTDDEHEYATLAEACQDAASGGVIELRFNGPLPQPPIRIHNKRLTIRAAADYRPVVDFQLRSDQPQGAATRMIHVTGATGALVIQDVNLLLQVPSGSYERWAMFSLVQAQQLKLERVSIVIANPNRYSAAVVEFVPPPGDDPGAMMPGSMQPGPVALDWHDCLVRAECDFLVSEALDPADIRLENVALAARGWLARINGQVSSRNRSSDDDRRLTMHLEYVTALLHEGAVFVDTGLDQDRDFCPVKVDCDHTALIVRPQRTLIAMRGVQEIASLRRRLTWSMRSSVVDVTGPFWESTQLLDAQSERFTPQDLGLSSQQVIESDLLRDPFRWGDAQFSLLTEDAFELKTPIGNSSARTVTTGVRFGEPMPPADAIANVVGLRPPPGTP